MPNQNLIKSFIDVDGKRKLAEYEPTDFAAISQGGTGATSATQALTNLGGVSQAELTNVDIKTDGSVTIHSDVSDAGSGQIITTGERNLINSALQSETLTTFAQVGDQLRYVDENGVLHTADLSPYIDDTNLARITGGTFNSTTNVLTLNRDDGSSFNISGFNISVAGGFKDFISTNTPGGIRSTSIWDYLTLTTTIPEAGNYKLSWFGLWSYDRGSEDIFINVVENGNTIALHVMEPQDTGGGGITVNRLDSGGTLNSGTNQRYPFSGHWILNLPAGSRDFTIRMTTSDSSQEAVIYQACLSLEQF